ncbi:MAG: hypothetical protein AAFP90_23300, partial [Planctomycetota bacterium]
LGEFTVLLFPFLGICNFGVLFGRRLRFIYCAIRFTTGKYRKTAPSTQQRPTPEMREKQVFRAMVTAIHGGRPVR